MVREKYCSKCRADTDHNVTIRKLGRVTTYSYKCLVCGKQDQAAVKNSRKKK